MGIAWRHGSSASGFRIYVGLDQDLEIKTKITVTAVDGRHSVIYKSMLNQLFDAPDVFDILAAKHGPPTLAIGELQ